ncbi:NADH:flavin oxidoreductase/NADH oxidase family protein [Pseudomonas yamanorum]|uniref:NADH:flavin oxidoreductase/NADH oxidase family protein n=1 Tax=Pseudomonas yamanorum TaxID=515393 RepID=UPI001C43BDBD|nr:NADH:flavin oxidoreductase/NADH oxidase family protein [Pseudomonas yamanorum]MBV6659730.1 NADH:flavin oxidoreductase/NADH oxidase family protein [Pseudomonas yamanorum]
MKKNGLFDPLTLPNGTQIKNRMAKASMEENLADENHAPGKALIQLYRTWAEGGAGLIITGNVMVDRHALTGPKCMVLDTDRSLGQFKALAEACRRHGAQAWMQINHPGRQLMADMGQEAVGPSAIAVNISGLKNVFAVPRALNEQDIENLINRYAQCAVLAYQSGFTGVQVHAAHGYLFSQFLSPLSNTRTDRWGGTIENRARILLSTLDAIRARVPKNFCLAVKLNSADFQRGGFGAADAARVVQMLNEKAVDLVEISGGSYESPAMQGETRDGSTLAREAYFLEFAQTIGKVAGMPIMVTGGIRRKPVAQRVIEGAVSMVGMATALAIEPALPRHWQNGNDVEVAPLIVPWKNKVYASVAMSSLVKRQMKLLSLGKPTNLKISPLWVFMGDQLSNRCQTRRYQKWIANA